MVIDMQAYKQSRISAAVAAARFDQEHQELLCVNWNPAIGAIARSSFQTPEELSPRLPEELADIDPDFVERAQSLATQI